MLSSFCSPLNSIPDIPGIISVVTAGIILVVGIISVVIGSHFGGRDHFDGGDHFGGGTGSQSPYPILVYFLANDRPDLSHFLENVIFAFPTYSLSINVSALSVF